MKASAKCYDLIKRFEGLRLMAYQCSAGVWTIGYGSTMYQNGSRIKPGDMITIEQAQTLIEWEVNNKASVINSLTLKVMLTQNQFDALVSFAYNVGVGAFSSSTLFKVLNKNPWDIAIKNEFARWNKANGVAVEGLTRRRRLECNVYFEV